jgi:subtilisin family serine protease
VFLLPAGVGLAADLPDHVPGRLLIGLRQDVRAEMVDRVLGAHRAVVRKHIPQLEARAIQVPEESSAAILDALRKTGLFRYVERDRYAHTASVPNDPDFSSQWHLARIQAPRAWDVSTGASSVIVAVVDSGVDPSHPDLAPKLVPGWNFLNSTSNTADVLGHGTAVAGTVAAASNNGIGVAGVAWGSLIMPLEVVDAGDSASYSDIAAAIQYAADHGARIVNLSLGGAAPSELLQSAVDYAWNRGAVVFAAAMNNGTSVPAYPAACNHAVAVGATDAGDGLASFSSFGNWIALTAPGTGILTTSLGGGYGYWTGTSFSAPIAAGVAALALSANPALGNSDLVNLLEGNADDLGAPGHDDLFGWGLVNAYKAVNAASQSALNPPGGFTPIRVNAGGPAYVDAQGQTWSADTGYTAGAVWSTNAAIGNTASPTLYQTCRYGPAFSYNFPAPDGTYTVKLKFAEPSRTGPGQRVFNIAVNGAPVLANFDIFAQAGGANLALDLSFTVAVTGGQVAIKFLAGNDWPMVNAIEILPGAHSNAIAPIRINAGGASYTDPSGLLWSADTGFSDSYVWSVDTAIANTAAPALYQTCRYGPAFDYRFTVPDGSYTVTLKFAEPSRDGPGQRVFNVAINGAAVLPNFDIFARAGGEFVALDQSFNVSVTGGQIAIQFTAGNDWPMINAIEILPN